MLERRRGKQNSAPFYEHLHRRVDNEMQSRARAMMATETPTHIDVAPFPRDTTIQTPMAHPQYHIQQSTTTTLYIPSPSQTTSTANDLTPSATTAQGHLNVPAATTSLSKGKQRATRPNAKATGKGSEHVPDQPLESKVCWYFHITSTRYHRE